VSEDFDFRAARENPARLEKMKPILDRIPPEWGKYLPEVGWDDLLLEANSELEKIDPDYVIAQAKQKFGELRLYTFHSDEFSESESDMDRQAFQEIITRVEDKSVRTCEYCGKDAQRRSGGWISVLCDDHAKVDET
jgi:hypothetical protein